MATSYTHPLGSGDRRAKITATCSANLFPLAFLPDMLDGTLDAVAYFYNGQAVSAQWIKFDFGSPQLIDEITLEFQGDQAQGVWKVQGSSNDADWTDIGTSFTWGDGSWATQVVDEISSNTTYYRYYRIQGVSGTLSNGNYQFEIKFKIESWLKVAASNRNGSTSAGTSLSVSLTIPEAADTLLLVWVWGWATTNAIAVSTPTWNTSEAFTKLDGWDAANPWESFGWIGYLKVPTAGAYNVTVGLSNTLGVISVGAVALRGINQTTPCGTPDYVEYGATAAISEDTPSAVGELVIDNLFYTDGFDAATVGGGQTQLWNNTPTNNNDHCASTEPGATSVNMAWTIADTVSDAVWWGISVKASDGPAVFIVALPDSDIAAGSWLPSTGSTLYECIDEAEASDTDYIYSPHLPVAELCDVGLTAVSDPAVSVGHTVRFRYRKNVDQGEINLTVQLREGSVVIAQKSIADIPATWTDDSFLLSEAEADSITDYSNLSLRFITSADLISFVHSDSDWDWGVASAQLVFTMPSATDNCVVVGLIGYNNSGVVTGVTIDGTGGGSMTKVESTDSGGRFCELYGRVGVAAGTRTITVSGSDFNIAIMAMVFSGVDQTTPFGSHNSATGSSTSPAVAIANISGNVVVDVAGNYEASEIVWTPNAGQIERITEILNGRYRNGMSVNDNLISSDAWTQGTSDLWLICAAELNLIGNAGSGMSSLDTDLYAYWTFDEYSGSRYDVSGNGKTLSQVGTVPSTTGKKGKGALFSGTASSNYLTRSTDAGFDFNNTTFTVAAWFKAGAATGPHEIISKDASWFLGQEDDFLFFMVTTDWDYVVTPSIIEAGEWYFVVAWNDETEGTTNIQVNNGTVYSRSVLIGYTGTNLMVGYSADNTGETVGVIDEIGIWKGRVLTQAERTYLYNSGVGRSFGEW